MRFNVRIEPTILFFNHRGQKVEVKVYQSRLVVNDVGEISSDGDSLRIDTYTGHDHVCSASGFAEAGGSCSHCQESKKRGDLLRAAHKYVSEVYVVQINEDRILESVRKAELRKSEQERLEEEERKRRIKAEVTKQLPTFLKQRCLPVIQEVMCRQDPGTEAKIKVGLKHDPKEYFMAEAARCALVDEGFEAKLDIQTHGDGSITIFLQVNW